MVEILKNEFILLGQDLVHLVPRLLLGLVIFIIFLIIARLTGGAVRKIMAKTSTEGHVDLLVARLVSISITAVGLVAALGVMKINLTALMAGLGLTGFAIGFALKDLIGNFLSGIIVLLQRPFTLGDHIKVQDVEGTVTNMRVRDTIIKTQDGQIAHIPNSVIFNNTIINYTTLSNQRLSVTITIGAGEDIGKAIQACSETLNSNEAILKSPTPEVLISELAESSVSLEARFWINAAKSSAPQTKSEVTQQVIENLLQAGIAVPPAGPASSDK